MTKRLRRLDLPSGEPGNESPSLMGSPPALAAPRTFHQIILPKASPFSPIIAGSYTPPPHRFQRGRPEGAPLALPDAGSPPALSVMLPEEPTPAPAKSTSPEADSEIECIAFDEASPAAAPTPESKGPAYFVSYFRSRCLSEQPALQQSVIQFLEEQEIVLTRVVASGANGITFEGEKNGIRIIFKALRQPEAIAANKGNHLLEGMSHSSLIQIKGICRSGDQLLGVLMEKAEGNTLKSLILGFRRHPKEFLKIAKGVAAGLVFFKINGLLHRDIQPNNILVNSEGNVKIVDFDLLQRNDGACTEIVGTESFRAPEMPWGAYSYPVDAFSFGKVLRLLAKNVDWTGREDLQAAAEEILRGLMKQEPADRTDICLAYERFQKLEAEASV